ncbi:hypothetical protein CQW23_30585 [Capsicum baccatum]|uniref:SHSP domain-containing protein n=1 Tax=Capsicum baccatum TaxID=33114 RepID=A0A2G2VA05_CAPBA|nr:hypothetical protein CQW23_30585 [Capsicum baccatum]
MIRVRMLDETVVNKHAIAFDFQLRLPENAGLEHIKAHLENGVVKITVPKLGEDKKKQNKVISIADKSKSASGEAIKATKVEM